MRYLWLGVGTAAVGIGAALAGSGIAAADTGSDQGTASGPVHRATAGHAATQAPARSRAANSTADPASPPASVRRGATAIAALPVAAVRAKSAPAPAATTYSVANALPPRSQWLTNDGYCGETSFVSAGLYYGQYVSQYDARALASRNAPQNITRSQLLLGVNDVAAAKAMHLTATPFNTAAQTTTASFLTWIKSNVTAGYPVAIGVYTNEFRFYGDRNPTAGDPDYDHIVTVTGITSAKPLTAPAAYNAADVITFSDHALWTGTPTGNPQYLFSYPFATFPADRRRANAAGGPVYSLPSGPDYGIALTGVADQYRETVPVRLTTSTNGESPAIREGSTVRPAAKPVTLTITVSGLKPGASYNLYRYSSMAAVPDGSFNANAGKATQKWKVVATGSTYTMTQTIMSNEVAAYRAVPVTAR